MSASPSRGPSLPFTLTEALGLSISTFIRFILPLMSFPSPLMSNALNRDSFRVLKHNPFLPHRSTLLGQRGTSTLRILFHRETFSKLNTPNYHLTRHGTIQYYHPPGTHNEAFWATALTVQAAEENPPPSRPL